MNNNLDDVTKIQESLKNEALSVGQIAEFYTKLAGWYSYYAQMLKGVKLDKAAKWLEIKASSLEKPYSDTHTDRLWEATDTGRAEIALEWELKKIEQLMRAIKARLYVSDQEAHNSY